MTAHPRPIHAALPGQRSGNHRTDGRCPCEPLRLNDMNEPGRVVFVHRTMTVHRPFDADAEHVVRHATTPEPRR